MEKEAEGEVLGWELCEEKRERAAYGGAPPGPIGEFSNDTRSDPGSPPAKSTVLEINTQDRFDLARPGGGA